MRFSSSCWYIDDYITKYPSKKYRQLFKKWNWSLNVQNHYTWLHLRNYCLQKNYRNYCSPTCIHVYLDKNDNFVSFFKDGTKLKWAKYVCDPPIYLNWLFPILQFEINWIFFPVQTDFFSSFMARVKYFDGPCLTIYSLSTIYRDIHYQFLVWWIHYSHCYESKR